eukprot:CAMPEP_0205804360 /NCGR_PEP_ID=MMETSP0205-20121125/7259_1 /ASSEMBLY_ACC=CAM_ASM_000278 /TAXON_ID=36767 /ORGANISM="Euplotes focardii, Strain TN1" /LENGTH=207 /DNA_ID=CAMNT_0053073851 /DNA_START=1 /DNA_END=621 /DNA_ORIENTATION=-
MKLNYFSYYGRVEEIRLLFHIKSVEFENVLINEEWPTVKGDKERFPFATMPTFEQDGKVYCQSLAILRKVARENGYYPNDAEDAYYQDVLTESLRDLYDNIFQIMESQSDEEKETITKKFETTIVPVNFSAWEDIIKANSSQEFWHGDSETIADLSLVCFYADQILIGAFKDSIQAHLEKYPALKEYLEKKHEAHKDYFNNRPDYPC